MNIIHIIKKLIIGDNSNFILTEELKAALRIMDGTNENLFITGNAGTGKSSLIEYFRNYTKKKAVVLAPTGLSALNVHGQTIHSFFNFPPKLLTLSNLSKLANDRLYREIDTIIIDEISMVRADLFEGINLFLREYGRNKLLPFGGIQLIVVGDLFQLPPVLTSEEKESFYKLYNSPYFFSTKAFEEGNFKIINLTKFFRQKDDGFINLLNNIRIGNATSNSLSLINDKIKNVNKINDYIITLTTTNKVSIAINEEKLNSMDHPLYTYKARIEGIFPTDNKSLPMELELKLKKSAKVLFIKNDKGRRWVNGTQGIIYGLSDKYIKVKIKDQYSTKIVEVSPETWENIKYEYDGETQSIKEKVIGKLIQYPLKLAWAITIHKSQGMTFDSVTIDFSKSPFAHGQTYVALSRCRSLNNLHLRHKIWPNDIIVDKTISEFTRNKLFKK
jgi:ATP-dependent exoDNAse (exonuclease V) alpha subunit